MEQTGNKTIAKNATMLYLRMFFTLAISFYTSRVVLQALGVSDYGIYNVVGGVIGIINILSGPLNSTTSRFLTYALGKNNPENLNQTFTTAAWVHIALAIVFIVSAETLGLWFVNTQLVIPDDRMNAANWVYQASIVAVVTSITQTPYNASIISHERISVFAYIAIIESLVKLGIASLLLIYSGDHLILYSILLVLSAISFQLYYRYYCIKHFCECHITRAFNKQLFKKMLSFSSWSMFGSITLTLKNQGVNILLNRFFGTLLNAAAGVALQVQGILYAFTSNISAAFCPQIIKSYAVANYQRVNELIGLGTRFTVLVTILTTIPFIFNMDFLMSLWLKEVPSGAVVICQILLFANFFNSFNPFINTAITASGKIKSINIALSTFYVVVLFGTWGILKLTHSYVWAYILGLVSCPLSTIAYIIILKQLMPTFSTWSFVSKTYLPLFGTALVSFSVAAFMTRIISNPLMSLIFSTAVCTLLVFSIAYFFVFDDNIRKKIREKIKSTVRNVKKSSTRI